MFNLETVQHLAQTAIWDDSKNVDIVKLDELKAQLGDDSLAFRSYLANKGAFADHFYAVENFTDAYNVPSFTDALSAPSY